VTSNGIATSNTLTIDTRSKILQGAVNEYVGYRPSKILLNADKGINYFYAGSSPDISATSSNGAIHLTVYAPGKLTIKAPSSDFGDVYVDAVHGLIGNIVNIAAGRDIYFPGIVFGGSLTLNAGRDANLYNFLVTSLDVTASSIYFNSGGKAPPVSTVWISGGDLTAKATGLVTNPDRPSTTGDILFNNYSAVHIDGGKSLTLDAYGSVNFGVLESLGPVSMTAHTGDIILRNDVGPPIQFYIGGNFYKYAYYNGYYYVYTDTYDASYIPSFDPNGIGVASLYLNAVLGDISMQGAKAAGAVTIYAGGILTAQKGIFSGTPSTPSASSINITAVKGAWEDGTIWHEPVGGKYQFLSTPETPSFGTKALAAQAPLEAPWYVLPITSPGPAVAPPGLPGALTALPALPPGLATVSGHALPPEEVGAPITPGPEQEVEANQMVSNAQISEIIPVEDEEEGEEENRKKILKISYERSATQVAELGFR
jgi:hypothetical protein